MSDETQAVAVTLTELLRRIPADASYVWTEPDGLKATHYHPIGRYAQEAADEIDRLRAERDGLREDAERYRHCQLYGFPVRNQSGNREKTWIAFSPNNGTHFGATSSDAIDAALASTTAGSQPTGEG